jgi:hypothetical protein
MDYWIGGLMDTWAWQRGMPPFIHGFINPLIHSEELVARGGSAPPTAGCRPAVILFHHRAEKIWPSRLDLAR